jgi:hypothetical protein
MRAVTRRRPLAFAGALGATIALAATVFVAIIPRFTG